MTCLTIPTNRASSISERVVLPSSPSEIIRIESVKALGNHKPEPGILGSCLLHDFVVAFSSQTLYICSQKSKSSRNTPCRYLHYPPKNSSGEATGCLFRLDKFLDAASREKIDTFLRKAGGWRKGVATVLPLYQLFHLSAKG